MPDNVAVPVPGMNVTPLGKMPDSVMDGVGAPVAVIVKLPFRVIVNVVLLRLVITGAEVGVTITVPDAELDPTEFRALTEQV